MGGYLLNLLVLNNFVFEFKFDLGIFLSSKTLTYGLIIFAIFTIMIVYSWFKGSGKNPKKLMQANNDKNMEIYTGLEQAHFQSEKELDKNFKKINYAKLPLVDVEGIPIIAEEKSLSYDITFSKPAHTLVIGTTGSGKTTTFVNPTIQILSQTKSKPSMLISDPKGELYSLHAKSLIKKGYDVKVLDLRNPYCSVRWNPLEKPYDMYQEMLSLDKQVEANDMEGYYIFDEKIYYSEEEVNSAVQVRKQTLYDEIYEELNDICSVLCPVTNTSEPIWESGAKNFILAICLAMLEDSANEELEMTREKFNFYNIMKVATNTQNDCADLMEYFRHRGQLSKAVSLSKQVLDASDKTRGSYLSTIFDKLSLFSDMSICSLTSANEISFEEMATKPTALFLQIPDERATRHTLAAMVILQAYKALVAKANTYESLSLPRSVYFILDEFGNLPKVHKLEQMITVGRSRKIWLALVVQSYAQLAKVYDDKSADIIKSNCNIQVFIGTTDQKTIEEFSKKCGNYSIIQKNVSFSSASDSVGNSVSVKERPLIYPTELQQLNNANNMGNAIVSVFGYSPIKSRYTPSFECKHFRLDKTNQLLSEGKFFSEESVFYDMLERNEILQELKNANQQKQQEEYSPFKLNILSELNKLDLSASKNENIKFNLKQAIELNDFEKLDILLNEINEEAKTNDLLKENIGNITSFSSKAENLKNFEGSKPIENC